MDDLSITHYIIDPFKGVETTNNFGYTFFFSGADRTLPFVTLAAADNDDDRVSKLDRPAVFRLNIGVSKQTVQSLFGADRVASSGYNFTALDVIMPHPVYAPQSFVCVLNPSDATFEKVPLVLAEASELAVRRDARRKAH